jgi:NADPH:quinone reductase-like Zn-dependent oxidoreductase
MLVDIEACAINHGDKTFLKIPPMTAAARAHDVWGASAVGRVVAIGKDVPESYAGKRVAVYRSLRSTPDTVGLWCERAQVHRLCCLILPEEVAPLTYSGSLVNAITAYAFLEQAADEGHRAVAVTAGNSATGKALCALARPRNVRVIHLVRAESAREELREHGADHILLTTDVDFDKEFGDLSQRLGATAVFDGVGGEMVGRLAPILPMNSTFYFYGFLAGGAPSSITTMLFMTKNLTMKRFSNFESPTVKDSERLNASMLDLQAQIDNPLFQTKIGREFAFDRIDEAMQFEAIPGAKAVLVR